MEHIILGVDPGTLILGYSLISVSAQGEVQLLDMDVLYLKREPDYNRRMRNYGIS